MNAVRKATGKAPLAFSALCTAGTTVGAGWFSPAAVADVPVWVRRESVGLLFELEQD